jgi:hypothetical protein
MMLRGPRLKERDGCGQDEVPSLVLPEEAAAKEPPLTVEGGL